MWVISQARKGAMFFIALKDGSGVQQLQLIGMLFVVYVLSVDTVGGGGTIMRMK